MRPVWRTLLIASGRGRLLLVTAATAVATGLLLVAVSIARLPSLLVHGMDGYTYRSAFLEQEVLIGPITDPGTRGGAVLGVALLAMPLLLLLDQAVRLGSSARERRYAALAVAGATRADRRRWGVVEVGLPATAGAVLGVLVWLVLRLGLGSALNDSGRALVPTDTGPGWWGLLVVAAISVFGASVGIRQGSREAAVLPAAASRRPLRWAWPSLLLGVAGVLVVLSYLASSRNGAIWSRIGGWAVFAEVALAAVGLAGLSPWLARVTARVLSPRARTAAGLLAVRRLDVDPRPAGRAAAAIGAIGLAGGVMGPLAADVLEGGGSDAGYYLGPLGVAAVCAVLALLVVCGTLAVHSTETVLLRRRQMAGLVASGVEPGVIVESQRLEALMATVPLAMLGSTIGGLSYGLLGGSLLTLLAGVASSAVTVALVVVAASWASRLMSAWVADAVRPVHLRAE